MSELQNVRIGKCQKFLKLDYVRIVKCQNLFKLENVRIGKFLECLDTGKRQNWKVSESHLKHDNVRYKIYQSFMYGRCQNWQASSYFQIRNCQDWNVSEFKSGRPGKFQNFKRLRIIKCHNSKASEPKVSQAFITKCCDIWFEFENISNIFNK